MFIKTKPKQKTRLSQHGQLQKIWCREGEHSKSRVKLKAVAKGVVVRRQARIASHYMHALARLQVTLTFSQFISWKVARNTHSKRIHRVYKGKRITSSGRDLYLGPKLVVPWMGRKDLQEKETEVDLRESTKILARLNQISKRMHIMWFKKI
ncbi:hypothetical protein YC2023_010116 [Brassica napus]